MIRFNRKKAKRFIISRALPMFLAAVMLFTSAPMTGISVGEGDSAGEDTYISNTPLKYDYDTLKITKDGDEVSELEIYSHEKIEVSGAGLNENAKYQWQIKHPEKNNLWVDIYDATEDNIGVSVALINNMMAEDGTAKLRLRAYTEDYAYLSRPVTVTLLEEEQPSPTLSVDSVTFPSALAGSDEYVTVTIEYIQYDFKRDAYGNLEKDGSGNLILDNGKQAFSAYVATLVNGNPLKTTVKFPTIVGYDSFWQDEATASTSYTFNEDSVTQNYVYKVSYKPKLVNYSIRYYLQNIYDDQYTEKASETGLWGYTGAEPEDIKLNRKFEGFTSLYHEPDTIAADGSTVFEVYYERNYYLMEFDCNGGYGTETLYVRYESYIVIPDPVRTGYVFKGWDLVKSENPSNPVASGDSSVDAIEATMPAYNSAYRAIWDTAKTKFTVIYWVENANDDGYSYYSSDERTTHIGGDTVESADEVTAIDYNALPSGLNSAFFSYNASKTTTEQAKRDDLNAAKTKVIVKGDGSTVLNVYFDRSEFTLKFYYAMSTGTGENIEYSVVGGSTHYFGSLGDSKYDEIDLLDRYISEEVPKQQVGKVKKPTLNALGQTRLDSGKYTSGTETSKKDTNYTYYYISFDAKYGADISELWPCAVFDDVTIDYTIGDKNDNWQGTTASVSAWNGEFWVKYTRDNSGNNENQTIKGKYELLDENILWNRSENGNTVYADSNGKNSGTVAYLCFWENGANVGWSIPELYRYNIWLETYPEQNLNGLITIQRGGKTYYRADVYNTCDNSDVNEQTQPSITGYKAVTYDNADSDYKYDKYEYKEMTGHDTLFTNDPDTYFDKNKYVRGYNVNFYYDANGPYTLKLTNLTSELSTHNGLYFGTPLRDHEVLAEQMQNSHYPIGIEPGSREFGGWYTTAEWYDGTEVDWSNLTMPDANLTLYAKWTPIERTVTFYSAFSDIQKDEDDTSSKVYYFMQATGVPHGTPLGSAYLNTPEFPTDLDTAINGGDLAAEYDFVGWFYMDESNKKRFAPDSMEVTRDLVLFAEWQTAIDTTYVINYVLGADVAAHNTVTGTQAYPKDTVISDRITAHATVGQTKTFEAMSGKNLYTDFQKKFFPTVNSHSILMDRVPSNNTYTFEYMYDDMVLYKIQYLEQGTNKELHSPEIFDSDEAIISKKFKPIQDYLPTAYYITRTLQYDANATEPIEANVFTFYYVKDNKHALYSIEYYWENVDSTDSGNLNNYTLRESIIGTGDLNDSIEIEVKDDRYTGFGFQHCTVVNYVENGDEWTPTYTEYGTIPASGKITGTITMHGLEIKIYYKRNLMPYTIQYVEYGGDSLYTQNFTDPSQRRKFGTTVTYTAPATHVHDGLTYYFYATADKPQTQSFEIRAVEAENVITFYYKLKQYTINYVAYCPIPGAVQFGIVSPNMNIGERTTDITGSSASALSGYKFVGWRDDAGNLVSTNALWNPGSFERDASDKNPGDGIITYYAYFMPVSSSLVINKTVDVTTTDTFLFHIQGSGKFSYVDMIVSIQGSGSVTINEIPQGEYTITELTGWSWEYDCTSASAYTITIGSAAASVTFTNKSNPSNWLNGETHEENVFNN